MTHGQLWGDEVVDGVIHGHESLMYAARPRSMRAVLAQSRRWADRPFILYGDRTVTFGELDEMVQRFARDLRANSVRPTDRVAILAANTPEWVATFFAILEVGAIVVPCNGWWSAEEMAHACAAVVPTVVVVDERRADRVPPGVRCVPLASLGSLTDNDPSSDVGSGDANEDEDRPAVILFTAGTTDFPKGAVLSHRALISNLQTLLVVSRKLPHQITDDNPASTALVGLPLFHIGAIQLILVPMMTGSRIVFLEGRFNAANVLELIESRRVTMFSGVPTMMERLLADQSIETRDLSSLRTVVLGGAPVDDGLLSRIRAAFPATTRGVGRTYGLTETGGVVSTGVGAQIDEHPGSSGRLAPVVEARIAFPDDAGHGEIFVRSPAGMDGYWGMLEDDTVDADGWIRTGDIGWVDDDRFLYITGRAKDVIIRGGENIAAARVEAVLREHPGVCDVAVVGLPDPDLGEIVGAVVQVDSLGDLDGEELTAYAATRLAHFAVPSRWWFREEPLPTNDAGKVTKGVLLSDWLAAVDD